MTRKLLYFYSNDLLMSGYFSLISFTPSLFILKRWLGPAVGEGGGGGGETIATVQNRSCEKFKSGQILKGKPEGRYVR